MYCSTQFFECLTASPFPLGNPHLLLLVEFHTKISRLKPSNVPSITRISMPMSQAYIHGTLAIFYQLSTTSPPGIAKGGIQICWLVSEWPKSTRATLFCSSMSTLMMGSPLFFTCLGRRLMLTSLLNHFPGTQTRCVQHCCAKNDALHGMICTPSYLSPPSLFTQFIAGIGCWQSWTFHWAVVILRLFLEKYLYLSEFNLVMKINNTYFCKT